MASSVIDLTKLSDDEIGAEAHSKTVMKDIMIQVDKVIAEKNKQRQIENNYISFKEYLEKKSDCQIIEPDTAGSTNQMSTIDLSRYKNLRGAKRKLPLETSSETVVKKGRPRPSTADCLKTKQLSYTSLSKPTSDPSVYDEFVTNKPLVVPEENSIDFSQKLQSQKGSCEILYARSSKNSSRFKRRTRKFTSRKRKFRNSADSWERMYTLNQQTTPNAFKIDELPPLPQSPRALAELHEVGQINSARSSYDNIATMGEDSSMEQLNMVESMTDHSLDEDTSKSTTCLATLPCDAIYRKRSIALKYSKSEGSAIALPPGQAKDEHQNICEVNSSAYYSNLLKRNSKTVTVLYKTNSADFMRAIQESTPNFMRLRVAKSDLNVIPSRQEYSEPGPSRRETPCVIGESAPNKEIWKKILKRMTPRKNSTGCCSSWDWQGSSSSTYKRHRFQRLVRKPMRRYTNPPTGDSTDDDIDDFWRNNPY